MVGSFQGPDWIAYGKAAGKSKDYTEAIRCFSHALAEDPLDPDIHAYLGVAYFFTGDVTKAIEHLEGSLRINAGHPLANHYLNLCRPDQPIRPILSGRGDDVEKVSRIEYPKRFTSPPPQLDPLLMFNPIEDAKESEAHRFCPNCGRENSEDAIFCGRCGAGISIKAAQTPMRALSSTPRDQMTFADSISTCLSKYADFTGRASRPEYWWFYLFTVLIGWVSALGGLFVPVLVSIAFLLPQFAAGSRRLHDTNRSGWWQLLLLTCVGIIPLIIWLASKGSDLPNRYGDPV